MNFDFPLPNLDVLFDGLLCSNSPLQIGLVPYLITHQKYTHPEIIELLYVTRNFLGFLCDQYIFFPKITFQSLLIAFWDIKSHRRILARLTPAWEGFCNSWSSYCCSCHQLPQSNKRLLLCYPKPLSSSPLINSNNSYLECIVESPDWSPKLGFLTFKTSTRFQHFSYRLVLKCLFLIHQEFFLLSNILNKLLNHSILHKHFQFQHNIVWSIAFPRLIFLNASLTAIILMRR